MNPLIFSLISLILVAVSANFLSLIRENKTFGFEEYRKDPENIDGWYKVGNYSDKIYKNQKEAYKNACKNILWLKYKK